MSALFPSPAHPDTAAVKWRAWTDRLLSPGSSPVEQLEACKGWCDWSLASLGYDGAVSPPPGDPFGRDLYLSTGKALSPLAAARCVWEYRRTAVFLQGMQAALARAESLFRENVSMSSKPAAGRLLLCRCFSPFGIPPERVRFTLLDINEVSLEAAGRLIRALGVERSVVRVAADITQYRFATEERPHLIACEVLLRALKREPQVAATANLSPQLRPAPLRVRAVRRFRAQGGRLFPRARSGADIESLRRTARRAPLTCAPSSTSCARRSAEPRPGVRPARVRREGWNVSYSA